ncbi:MAG: WD40 repeat domain-containing protein [Planctomycetota bacterium]
MRTLFLTLALLVSFLEAYEPPITAVAFDPKGDQVVAASQKGLQVYSWPELKPKQEIDVPIVNLHAVAFSPNGTRLVVAGGYPSEHGSLSVLSWPELEMIASLRGHDDSIRAVTWVDDSSFVSASMDRNIQVWDAVDGVVTRTLEGHSRGINAACILQDKKTLMTSGIDQSVRVWDVESGKLLRSLNQHTASVNALAIRPSTEGLPILASAAADRTIRFWQPTIGRMMRYIRLDAKPLDVTWLSDGVRIAASCDDGRIRIVDWQQLKVVETIPAIEGWAYAIAAHPFDESCVVSGESSTIQRLPLTMATAEP